MYKKEPFTPGHRPKSNPGPVPDAARLVLLHKPFQVLCQFSSHEGKQTLSDVFASHKDGANKQYSGLYPAGRLDFDSEGLLLLTNHGPWQARVAHPRHKLPKTYWVQVEGVINEDALTRLREGIMLNDGAAHAVSVRHLSPAPEVAPRTPPVRYRAQIPTDWLEIVLDEGRNRQVRRMTAAVGLPTLRLIRVAIGPWRLDGMAAGDWREVAARDVERVLGPALSAASGRYPPQREPTQPAGHQQDQSSAPQRPHQTPSRPPTRDDRPATPASRTAPASSGHPSATKPPRKPRFGGPRPR